MIAVKSYLVFFMKGNNCPSLFDKCWKLHFLSVKSMFSVAACLLPFVINHNSHSLRDKYWKLNFLRVWSTFAVETCLLLFMICNNSLSLFDKGWKLNFLPDWWRIAVEPIWFSSWYVAIVSFCLMNNESWDFLMFFFFAFETYFGLFMRSRNSIFIWSLLEAKFPSTFVNVWSWNPHIWFSWWGSRCYWN